MGKKKKAKKGDLTAQAGSSGRGGASFHPADLPEEEASTVAPEAGAVPLGLPISLEDYDRLQKKARHRHLPPNTSAQEDASASSGDG